MLLEQFVVVTQTDEGTAPQLLGAHGRHVNEEEATFDGSRLDRNDRRGLVACLGGREIDCVVHIDLED
jgi:hypothetical protein